MSTQPLTPPITPAVPPIETGYFAQPSTRYDVVKTVLQFLVPALIAFATWSVSTHFNVQAQARELTIVQQQMVKPDDFAVLKTQMSQTKDDVKDIKDEQKEQRKLLEQILQHSH